MGRVNGHLVVLSRPGSSPSFGERNNAQNSDKVRRSTRQSAERVGTLKPFKTLENARESSIMPVRCEDGGTGIRAGLRKQRAVSATGAEQKGCGKGQEQLGRMLGLLVSQKPDLAEVVRAWDSLPDAVRKATCENSRDGRFAGAGSADEEEGPAAAAAAPERLKTPDGLVLSDYGISRLRAILFKEGCLHGILLLGRSRHFRSCALARAETRPRQCGRGGTGGAGKWPLMLHPLTNMGSKKHFGDMAR